MTTQKPLTVSLSGEFDLYREEELRATLVATYDSPKVIIDFTDVPYIDSSALRALVVKRNVRKQKGFSPAKLVGLSGGLRRIFKVTALDQIWQMYDTVDQAIQAFKAECQNRERRRDG